MVLVSGSCRWLLSMVIFIGGCCWLVVGGCCQGLLLVVVVRGCCQYCQNPNLTTTQPQPNLNLVGFDMIITLHHPTPHRNSNSTRRNGPRGLKFVMQHHPSILTTTQHNLTLQFSNMVNPTNIFFSLQKIFLDN